MNLRGLAALSPERLEPLLDRLPAEQRGQIEWRVAELAGGLLRLYETEPTRALIVEVQMLHEQLAASPWAHTGATPPEVDELIAGGLSTLRAYVGPAAADAADWAWYGACRPFMSWRDAMPEPLPSTAMDGGHAAWRDAPQAHDEGLGTNAEASINRGLVLLFAALRGAHQRLDVARTTELAYLAFEHACEGVDAAAAQGIHLADTRSAPEDRAARAIRIAEALRAELTEEDIGTLQSAHLGGLR